VLCVTNKLFMLSFVMLSVVMLSVVMVSVTLLSTVAPAVVQLVEQSTHDPKFKGSSPATTARTERKKRY
jgi:hypothetical protein